MAPSGNPACSILLSARRWRQTNAARSAPDCLIDFFFVADCQATGCFCCDEDRVAHFPARTAVPGSNILPKPETSKLEFRKLFFELPAQAILGGFSRCAYARRETS